MSKFALPLTLLALLGTAAAQTAPTSTPAPYLSQLQSSARVLIVFAPDAGSAAFQAQLKMIERHSFELSLRNTVVVPVSTGAPATQFSFENLPLAGADEQAAARSRFHVGASDFAVILLTQDGAEQLRSAAPVDIHSLLSRLDSLDRVAARANAPRPPDPLTPAQSAAVTAAADMHRSY